MSVISSENLAPCSHEETDTGIFVHARHAAMEGNKALVIKANDTDVLVTSIATLSSLQELGLQKMWIMFGQGSSLRYIAVHDITSAIGPEKMRGLLFFHAFTGMANMGCAEASDVFKKLSQYPPTMTDEDLKVLEKFVITIYDRSSTTTCVNDARLDLFARKQRSYEAIPPTQSALLQHTKSAAYHAGCVWSQATVCRPEAQSPANWGWIKHDQVWKICWTTLPHIAASCQELTKCGCKAECHGRYKC